MDTLIFGVIGSGKTTKALELAAAKGSYATCSIRDLTRELFIGHILDSEPATLIIDEVKIRKPDLPFVKSLISSNKVKVCVRGKPDRIINRPHYIFVTNNQNTYNLLKNTERSRFKCIEM